MFWKIEHFVRDFYNKHGPFEKVLDVGSYDVNGSVRKVISGYKEFVGIDMREGPGVDLVLNGHDISRAWDKPYFDFVTCCETLEHDVNFWETVRNIRDMLKPGGWLLVTTPSINFFRHDFPSDYYRFTESVYSDFIFKDFEDVHIELYEDKNDPVKEKPNATILAYGRKKK